MGKRGIFNGSGAIWYKYCVCVFADLYTIYIYSITIITIIQYWLLGDVMYLL